MSAVKDKEKRCVEGGGEEGMGGWKRGRFCISRRRFRLGETERCNCSGQDQRKIGEGSSGGVRSMVAVLRVGVVVKGRWYFADRWGGGEVNMGIETWSRTGNTCVRAAQRPETGSSTQDLSTLPTGV